MLDIDEKELAQIIRPVGFFNNKAKYIKQTAAILKENANGADVIDIPDTYEALIALPGVGPKMATLVMSSAWDKYVSRT
jgi:endonuclease-3